MLVKLNELFHIYYGHSLELNRLSQIEQNDRGIAFISRKMGDNGISAYVEEIKNLTPAASGQLTCALGGNGVLSTFLQETEFYTGRDVAILKPLHKMSRQILLFYCLCINSNKFKYSFGRQANKTLKDLLVPDIESIPNYVFNQRIDIFENPTQSIQNYADNLLLDTSLWKAFNYSEIFEIKKGYYNKKPPVNNSNNGIPFIGATEKNNGITSWIDISNLKKYSRDGTMNYSEPIENKIFEENCITVSNNGSVGEAFYQSTPFTCSHDINPLYLKNGRLNVYIAMFLITLIRAEKYRWGFGRKWRPSRMPNSIIKLPVNQHGKPDWDFMENYIKSLKFSSQL
ncbi:restriction endonuclease subunit S [Acinetobacter soli]|uniref:restriction endonuclease subunit S n=1 Tax=Acinetobacter soli TaxID=487316 RepID=UPI00124FF384|nr:restriction endonuclease subunit S [Acinetobacter soli]